VPDPLQPGPIGQRDMPRLLLASGSDLAVETCLRLQTGRTDTLAWRMLIDLLSW